MKNSKNISNILTAVIIIFSSILSYSNVYAGSVFINPATTTVDLNDSFAVTIEAQGFSSPIDSWGVDVSWDTSFLRLESANVNTTLWNFQSSTGDDSITGSLLNMGGARFGDASGDFNLATLSFTAIANGSTAIDVVITDDSFDAYRWGNFGELALPDNTAASGLVQVSSVPLPAGVWLMMTGLTTFLLGARRK